MLQCQSFFVIFLTVYRHPYQLRLQRSNTDNLPVLPLLFCLLRAHSNMWHADSGIKNPASVPHLKKLLPNAPRTAADNEFTAADS